MKFGDFASLVQLGIGIHAGTAVLQLLSEFSLSPLETRAERISKLVAHFEKQGRDLTYEQAILNKIKTDIILCKGRHFVAYRRHTGRNFGVAFLLLFILIWISFDPEAQLSVGGALILSLLCFTPALGSFIWLSLQARKSLDSAQENLKILESNIFKIHEPAP